MADESVTSSPSSPSTSGEIASALNSALSVASPPETPAASPTPEQTATPEAPAGAPPATPAPTDARTPPREAAVDPDADLSIPPTGDIPRDRHEKILATTRKKVEAEVSRRFVEEHRPWLEFEKHFLPNEFASLIPHLQTLSRDPRAFLQNAAQELGFQLVPIGQVQPAASDPEEPQPDIPLEDGRQLYSATQQSKRDAWLIQKVRQAVQQDLSTELQPIRAARQEEERRQFLQAIDDRAQATYEDVAKREGFEELRGAIATILQNDKRYSLEGAYLKAYDEQYRPTRDQKIRQAVIDELQQKGRAATSSLSPQRRSATEIQTNGQASTSEMLRSQLDAAGLIL